LRRETKKNHKPSTGTKEYGSKGGAEAIMSGLLAVEKSGSTVSSLFPNDAADGNLMKVLRQQTW
jgi:hypothetical protein